MERRRRSPKRSVPPSNPAWMEFGKCTSREVDSHLFDEDTTLAEQLKARAICNTCPVIEKCLAFGVKIQGNGTFGGVRLAGGDPRKLYSHRKEEAS